ncbi:MAG: FtsK/SpoIIIE domain-containing protein [Anaerolineae bacterium]|nr:FtsK/SpoIIIE domain-containing protein [Anaerolineae bacterium]MDW8173601.1 FtsK/SpoIIIE domain-containing protein [Anaerolineae bacterium]
MQQQPTILHRPPRIQPRLPTQEVEIPAPPEDQSSGVSMLELLLPLVTIVGYVIIALSGAGRSVALIVPMGAAMLGSIYVGWRRSQAERQKREAREASYRQTLVEMRQRLQQYQQMQRDYYHYTFPEPNGVLQIATAQEVSRQGPRVWERRPSDPDFLALRLGIGTRPSTVVYRLAKTEAFSPLAEDAARLARESEWLSDVPITINLRQPADREPDPANPVCQSLGITLNCATDSVDPTVIARDYLPLYEYVYSILAHYVTFHAPTDAQLYIIGTRASRNQWEQARRLPHTHRGQKGAESLVCFDDDRVPGADDAPTARLPMVLRELLQTLQTRQQRLNDKEVGDVTLPFLLVVVDTLGVADKSPLKELSDRALSLIMVKGAQLGAALIVLTETTREIPSEVQAIIELDPLDNAQTWGNLSFRYAETGLNTRRFIGSADGLREEKLATLVNKLSDYQIRVSAAAALVNAIDFLQMEGVNSIEDLDIPRNWERTRSAEGAEWPRVKIGARGAADMREIVFSADADGVHAMIAGTTGSGKSELLLTLIVGLAARYDPSVLNFVLVDFKGGAAFEEFRDLPHCVDIVTNLEGNAVDRMFTAIKAELDRRGEMIAQYGVKHIVEYRRRGYHLMDGSKNHRKLPNQPFPHLFIIIDEFAEMVSDKDKGAEYKAQLDSITRLGRAIGVSLILATQRPGNAITDQMRANIKLKICLRVETPDDSRELLRRHDAAYLPPSIPGRGYLQVGNEIPELIQVARAGGPYRSGKDAKEVLADFVWIGRSGHQSKRGSEQKIKSLSEKMVEVMDNLYTSQGRAEQNKPWPNPLPKYISLAQPLDLLGTVSEQYIKDSDDLALLKQAKTDEMLLSRALRGWEEGDPIAWEESSFSWDRPDVLRVALGLIDHPRQARQKVLSVDFKLNNVAIFGASWGKTTFLRSLILALAASHPPSALHFYLLDFGSLGLKVFESLPHVGAVIGAEESERVNRLLRRLIDEKEARKVRFAKASVQDLVTYNRRAVQDPYDDIDPIPALVVVIDNFAEVKENYDDLTPVFSELLREGRSAGIYFAASADTFASMGTKIINQFGQRIALTMSDKGEYMSLVGRGGTVFSEIYGRGLVNVERDVSPVPLEVQIAAPVSLDEEQITAAIGGVDDPRQEFDPVALRAALDDRRKLSRRMRATIFANEKRIVDNLTAHIGPRLESLVSKMERRWGDGEKPQRVKILPTLLDLPAVLAMQGAQREDSLGAASAFLGMNDDDLRPFAIKFGLRYNHLMLVGPPLSGRTTVMRTWVLSLAQQYRPHEVSFILIDAAQRLNQYGGDCFFSDLPHVLAVVGQAEELQALVDRLEFEYSERPSGDNHRPPREIFVMIDNYDDIGDLVDSRSDALKRLARLARTYQTRLHFILCGSPSIVGTSDELRKQVWQSKVGLALRTADAIEKLNGKMPRSLKDAELPVGRGFLVEAGRSKLIQIATYAAGENDPVAYAREVDRVIDRLRDDAGNQRHRWYYEVRSMDQVQPEAQAQDGAAQLGTAPKDVNGQPDLPSYDYSQAIKKQDLALSEALGQARRERQARNKANPHYADLLSAENIRKLGAPLLDSLGFNFFNEGTAETIVQQPVPVLRNWIDEGLIALPESLSAEQEAQVRAAIQAHDDAQRRLQEEARKARTITPEQEQQARERIARQNRESSVYELLSGCTLKTLPMEVLLLIPSLKADETLALIADSSAEELQAMIDNGRLRLPLSLKEDVLQAVLTHAKPS